MMGASAGRAALLICALLSPSTAYGQEPLAAAKELYASAAYEDALLAFQRLKVEPGQHEADAKAIHRYLAFCYIALNRQTEANRAIEELVVADPLYKAEEPEVSPRLRTAYRDVRKKHLTGAARHWYDLAKSTYDRKQYDKAVQLFQTTVVLLDDPDLSPRDPDLRMLAEGFLELSIANAAPPKPAPEPAPPPVSPPSPPPPVAVIPPAPGVYTNDDPSVTQPVTIKQQLPRFPTVSGQSNTRGLLELVIDESGKVESAVMRGSVNSTYDSLLLSASKSWRYRPAMRDGKPVKFRKLIQITVTPGLKPALL